MPIMYGIVEGTLCYHGVKKNKKDNNKKKKRMKSKCRFSVVRTDSQDDFIILYGVLLVFIEDRQDLGQ